MCVTDSTVPFDEAYKRNKGSIGRFGGTSWTNKGSRLFGERASNGFLEQQSSVRILVGVEVHWSCARWWRRCPNTLVVLDETNSCHFSSLSLLCVRGSSDVITTWSLHVKKGSTVWAAAATESHVVGYVIFQLTINKIKDLFNELITFSKSTSVFRVFFKSPEYQNLNRTWLFKVCAVLTFFGVLFCFYFLQLVAVSQVPSHEFH